MSAPVDVLAVLNHHANGFSNGPVTLSETGAANLANELREARAAVADLIAGYEQIKHSIKQAQIHGNDWRRELELIENTADAALARVQGGAR